MSTTTLSAIAQRPHLGIDPFAQQHAVDLALVDLDGELQCIIFQEQRIMVLPTPEPQAKSPAVADGVCRDVIWIKLEAIKSGNITNPADELVQRQPLNSLFESR